MILTVLTEKSYCDRSTFPFKMMNCIVSYLLFLGPQIVLYIELVSSLCDVNWSAGWLSNVTGGGYLILESD